MGSKLACITVCVAELWWVVGMEMVVGDRRSWCGKNNMLKEVGQ